MNPIAIFTTFAVAAAAAIQSVPEHNNWKLTIDVATPQALVVHTKGSGGKTVLAVTFTLKNETGAGRTITPFVTMTTDTHQSVSASYDPATHELLKLYGQTELVDVYELAGGIEDGATKKCVAVFEGVDPMANHYTLHFQGFAAPLRRYGKDFTQQQVEFRSMHWRVGNEFQVCSSKVVGTGSEWVTLETKKVR
jgi:hypothetical protein